MILFCHLLNDRSGSPTVLFSTIKALNTTENCVLYISSHGSGVLEETEIPIFKYWYRRSRHRIVTFFSFFASQFFLYRALSQDKDIPADATIYVNTLLPFGAMIWGRRTGRKVVVHVHEVSITPGPLRRFLLKCASHCADQLLYVSKDHLTRLPIPGPPSEVIFNPVNSFFRITSESIPYAPRRTGAFEVVMLASLRGYKGVEEFMSLAHALRNRKDILFTLVLNAEPDEVAYFKKHHPNVENVCLYSRTSDPSIFYSRADVVINLARTDQWIETFGLTLAEAMTFGVPVIAPPVGGPAEIVTHGQEGYCIDSRDHTALQTAILELADNPDIATKMSEAARLRSADFTFDSYANKLRSILTEL